MKMVGFQGNEPVKQYFLVYNKHNLNFLSSAFYRCKVSHTRLKKAKNSFSYHLYMMWIDLDEISNLSKKSWLFGYNTWSLHSFLDSDHMKFLWYQKDSPAYKLAASHRPYSTPSDLSPEASTKDKILWYLQDIGITDHVEKIFFLGHARVLGYVFNPVCFYYCYAADGVLIAILSQVTNTFGDQKPYVMRITDPKASVYLYQEKKDFYVSPFIATDLDFHFCMQQPREKFVIAINSIKKDKPELVTSVVGTKVLWSDRNILLLFFKHPLVTLKVIITIHYQSFKIYFKNVPYFKKDEADQEIVDRLHS